MRLRMLGIDHNLAPVDVRALFSFTRRQTGEFLEVLRKRPDVEGAVLLSTCNRTELYVSAGKPFVTDLYGMICKAKGQCADAYRDAWTCRSGMEAVQHLMELAAGLQSLIVGEDQILTQVKEALTLARACYATDRVTEVLFRQAVTMAKQTKSLFRIDHGDPSCASQAIAQFRAMGEDFAGRAALVIGNGMMGRLTAQALLDAGAKVYVTVRQYHSGIVDIPQGAVRIGYGERYDYIPRCDFVFSATASPNLTIKKESLEACLNTSGCGSSQRQECGQGKAPQQRGGERARIFVDLAVPRDMECSIDVLPGVKRYDIDDFASAKSGALQEQYRAVLEQANRGAEEFRGWYECRDLVPAVRRLAEMAAEDVCWRMEPDFLRAEDYGLSTVEQITGQAAEKTVSRMLFALRDGLPPEVFRDVMGALEEILERDRRKHS